MYTQHILIHYINLYRTIAPSTGNGCCMYRNSGFYCKVTCEKKIINDGYFYTENSVTIKH